MRVTESKPTGKVAVMGKKKHKKRKQEHGTCQSDSSDEGGSAERCPHLAKAINVSSLKKGLRQIGHIGQCNTCISKRSDNLVGEIITDESALGGAAGDMNDVIEEGKLYGDAEPTIWVCLQCGYQGCDRNSKEQHALKHYETPRSSMHSLVVNVNSWSVWCYLCNDEVNPESSSQLKECIDFIRKLIDASIGYGAPSVKRSGSFRADDQMTQDSSKMDSKPSRPKPISQQAAAGLTQALPKVKGLSNLGNTCFFNAVMQNLSQTNLLETLINERGMKGVQINLQGKKCCDDNEDGGVTSDNTASSEEEDDKIKCQIPALSVSLGEPGNLTVSVISFMRDMRNPSKCNTICPNSLFGQVCKKAPRFKGFQQQDSHELLRHLLDGMKAEEIKRAQSALLKQFKLPENVNPKKVDEEDKIKIKVYGRQAKHTFVDEVFGGVFLSTVLCDECNQPSQIYEPFLDISLPILEEKTLRPNMSCGRKKDDSDVSSVTSAVDSGAGQSLSKHQQKKLRKQSIKDTKKRAHCTNAVLVDSEVASGLENKDTKDNKMIKNKRDSQSLSDGQMSDADIEDNVESDVSRNKPATLNSQEDLDKPDSPVDNKTVSASTNTSPTANAANCVHRERHDSTGRSEESTLTETSAGESKTGCSSCNSIASLSDSTCKASSVESPLGSNLGLNQLPVQQHSSVEHLTEAMRNVSIAERKNTQNHRHLKESFKDSKSDWGSSASVSLDNTEETASTSNGIHHASSQRSHSSGYSSTTTSKSLVTSKSRAQLQLEAKVKAMASLVPRYQPTSQECSLKSCLNQFTAAEWLTGSNKFGCETCTKRKYGHSHKDGKKETVYTNASKQVIIFQPPAVLTLHLKRFQQVGFSLRKVNRHVKFPLLLDLAPYCSSLCQGIKSGQTKVLYALYGVVEHSGRLTGGHYTAYVKIRPHSNQLKEFINQHDVTDIQLEKLLEDLYTSRDHEGEGHCNSETQDEPVAPPAGKWYHISDSRVRDASEEAVLTCQAYILFYERIL